jgi:hypothetical protein
MVKGFGKPTPFDRLLVEEFLYTAMVEQSSLKYGISAIFQQPLKPFLVVRHALEILLNFKSLMWVSYLMQ